MCIMPRTLETSPKKDHQECLEKSKKRKKKHKHRSHRNQKRSHPEQTGLSPGRLKSKKPKRVEPKSDSDSSDGDIGPSLPNNLAPSTPDVKGPMTREHWEKQQSQVRRVFDPETGRTRLVRGQGEIIEEIVSKDRQKQINKMATAGDGITYQRRSGLID